VLGGREVLQHPGVLRALSPTYGAAFIVGDPKTGFLSLGPVFLAVTGAEAIYADMGHFGRPAITRAWLALCLPSLVINYMGQSALILAHPATVDNPFFRLVPVGLQLPMVILATVATVIASQAVISGAFSVTQQVMQLGFLPRVSIRHTSKRIMGQIYIPVVNWVLLAAVICLVLAFQSSSGLASAYGIALSAIFATNTLLAFVVFRVLWRKPLKLVIPGAALFLTAELTFFAANLQKVFSGGWLPLVVGAILFVILTTWHRGRILLGKAAREGRVSLRRYLNRMIDEPPDRVPGTAEGSRVTFQRLRLGFVAVLARYGYQDEPDAVEALRLARAHGLEIDVERASFFLDHVSVLPTGRAHMAGWRKRLFALLYQNSSPAARYYGLPPDSVFEVGAYVEL
jgi:KUP system potassium uptake protein